MQRYQEIAAEVDAQGAARRHYQTLVVVLWISIASLGARFLLEIGPRLAALRRLEDKLQAGGHRTDATAEEL